MKYFLIALTFFSALQFAIPLAWSARKERKSNNSVAFEITRINSQKAWPGVTLYPTTGNEKIRLLKLDGTVLHEWNIDATRARLLPNCNLLVVHGSPLSKKKPKWKKLLDTVREYDWNGNVIWEYKAPHRAHHDTQRTKDGNTIFLSRVPLRYNVATRKWREAVKEIDSAKVTNPDERKIHSDAVLEVSPAGKLVWSWKAHEHFSLDHCGKRPCQLGPESERWIKLARDWTHTNTVSIIPENKWYDAGDKRFKPGNIMIMPRAWWSALLIDRESKQVVWEYAGDFEQGLLLPHEAHMIPKGFPGAGNVLIFDNGSQKNRTYSIALEIDPQTKEVVWAYMDKENFFSSAAGSLQRLANGNTLISEDVPGRVFEVTPEKEIVWELQGSHRITRAHRYAEDYCPKLERSPLEMSARRTKK